MQKFVVGARVWIFRDAATEPVDHGVVESIEDGSIGSSHKIQIRSLALKPGGITQYGLFRQGWKEIFFDPKSQDHYHGGEKGSVFRFELI
jgi:hypothetical protein